MGRVLITSREPLLGADADPLSTALKIPALVCRQLSQARGKAAQTLNVTNGLNIDWMLLLPV